MKNNTIKQQKKLNTKRVLNYEKPVLMCYGDVRDVTLGPTAGLGESGNAFTRCPQGAPGCGS